MRLTGDQPPLPLPLPEPLLSSVGVPSEPWPLEVPLSSGWLVVETPSSGALIEGAVPAVGVLVDVASSAPCPPTMPPWSSTVLSVGVDESGAVDNGATKLGLVDELGAVVVTRIVVELGSGKVVTVEVNEGESSTDTVVASTIVVSAPGMNAGGGVVLTEFAAAKATPPKVTMAPTPAATVINRFFITSLQ